VERVLTGCDRKFQRIVLNGLAWRKLQDWCWNEY
jgi:hypothetical protein